MRPLARLGVLGAAAVLAAAAAALVAPPQAAWACSCAQVPVARALGEADAAFVGTLVERRGPEPKAVMSSLDPVTLTFAVDAVAKGQLGERVDVVTASSGASCGLELEPGDRAGILLHRGEGARWESGLCSQLAVRDLETVVALQPPAREERSHRALFAAAAAGIGLALAGLGALAVRRRRSAR